MINTSLTPKTCATGYTRLARTHQWVATIGHIYQQTGKVRIWKVHVEEETIDWACGLLKLHIFLEAFSFQWQEKFLLGVRQCCKLYPCLEVSVWNLTILCICWKNEVWFASKVQFTQMYLSTASHRNSAHWLMHCIYLCPLPGADEVSGDIRVAGHYLRCYCCWTSLNMRVTATVVQTAPQLCFVLFCFSGFGFSTPWVGFSLFPVCWYVRSESSGH